MKFINMLERKFGKYAIRGLIKYVVILEVLGVVVSVASQFTGSGGTSLYYAYFALDVNAILRGQVWRIFTFLIGPGINVYSMIDVLFFAIRIYFTVYIGNSLEAAWGSFRFNLYYFLGVIFNILAAVIIFLTVGQPFGVGMEYLNLMLFMAFAVLYPNMQVLLFFIIPIKVKWMGILYAFFWLYEILINFVNHQYGVAIAIFIAMANFALFYMATRNYRHISVKERKRRAKFRSQVRKSSTSSRHKCAVCGRTESDDDGLEFRYCSKCEGNYEYCSDHLFSHEHVRK